MELEYDPPPGHPNPPPGQRTTAPINWIFSLLLVVGVAALVGYYLGWF
jgi:hypothetical protein